MDHRAAIQAAAVAAAAAAASGGSGLPPGMVLDEATKNAMQFFLSQQYGMQQQQQQHQQAQAQAQALQQQQQQQLQHQQQQQAVVNTNDIINMAMNGIASGIPTLDMPTIMSYLGYGNTFPTNGGSGSSSKEQQNFAAKYGKLMEVIDEIGRDVRPLYAGSKGANDRLRRQINQARHLVRECLIEVDRAQR